MKWHTENHPGDWGLTGAIFIKDEQGKDICYIDYRTPYCIRASQGDMDRVKEAKEQAELIASAPDLLRTVNVMTRALKYAREIIGLMPNPDPDEMTVIDAAIALGESANVCST